MVRQRQPDARHAEGRVRRWASARATCRTARKSRTQPWPRSLASRGPATRASDPVLGRRPAAAPLAVRRRPRARGRHARRSARCAPSRTSRSRSPRASGARCSAPTAPARPRCSTPITGDFPPTAGPRPLLRRGRHRAAALRAHPHGAAAHLPVVAAVPRPHGPRQPLPRRARRRARPLQLPAGRAPRTRRALATDDLLERVRLEPRRRQRRSPTLSHGQQRQLEIGMALAGAPRLILFDEPAAGLSPGRAARAGGAARRRCRAHMGFVLIEHDLDIALRVVERVTVHAQRPRAQARHARARSRTTPRCRRSTWAEAGTDGLVLPPPRSTAGRGPILRGRAARRLLRPRPRAAGRLAHPRSRRARPSSAATAWARRRCATPSPGWCRPRGSVQLAGEEILGLAPQRDHRAAASATCRRAAASGRRSRSTSTCGSPRSAPARPVDGRAHLPDVPAPGRAPGNGGAQLSGGEQQMLAIGRALLFNPRLLVMDEPTEGLAPVIVEQVARRCCRRSPARARSRCC